MWNFHVECFLCWNVRPAPDCGTCLADGSKPLNLKITRRPANTPDALQDQASQNRMARAERKAFRAARRVGGLPPEAGAGVPAWKARALGGTRMPIRAYLYDAKATDREITLDAAVMSGLHDQQLLWVDLLDFDEAELRAASALLGLKRDSVYNLLQPDRRPRLDNYGDYFQMNIDAIEENDGKYKLVELNFVVGRNFVLTVHKTPVHFLESFDTRVKGDTQLGQLDAAAFLAALLDWHITSFFRIIELLEARVDRLDALALRPKHGRDVLTELAKLRQRVAFIRRTLTPHREVYAALSRPDFQAIAASESAAHYGLLNDRLERAIEAVENARDLLVGSFDMFTTQTALRTNEAMKTLTLVSVVLLPASVIIGIAGFLIKGPVYAYGSLGFWLMIAFIVLIGISMVGIAKWRRWI